MPALELLGPHNQLAEEVNLAENSFIGFFFFLCQVGFHKHRNAGGGTKEVARTHGKEEQDCLFQ